ncbi:phage tail sheath subtilisin-like domain-containing protein, partial [Clostridioides difficile]
MVLPEINISFIQAGKTFVKRSGGIVALILKDTKNIGLVEIKEIEDIPENYSPTNLDYIKMAMKGNAYPPNKILVYTLDTDELIDDALDFLETCEFNYLCMPEETEQDLPKIKTWINNGELILIKESGAIVIARGVTSFTTTTDSKGDIFKKIKLVDTLDQIHNDIKKIIVRNYIGKTPNTYDNKCLLIV